MKRNRRFRESLIVSPFSEADNRSFNEDEDFSTFFDGNVKDSSSEYADTFHYEINAENTGYIDEGILYIDPETDGTQITVTKVDENGVRTNYILDLSQSTPSFSPLRESRNSRRRRIF